MCWSWGKGKAMSQKVWYAVFPTQLLPNDLRYLMMVGLATEVFVWWFLDQLQQPFSESSRISFCLRSLWPSGRYAASQSTYLDLKWLLYVINVDCNSPFWARNEDLQFNRRLTFSNTLNSLEYCSESWSWNLNWVNMKVTVV